MTHNTGGLITPHGDRELAFIAQFHARGMELITPHGDREPGITIFSCSLSWLLITPHGDREPSTLFYETNPVGNPLITPHGDRELKYHHQLKTSRGAHYPSWGSGTFCGKPVRTKSVTSSLPLMGIGNHQTIDFRAKCRNLITPHGDREP